ncbi:hypothetical protein HGG71_05635 [Rhodobacteraceae bacterium R_SAG2]|nr:hypothetical protein [Rhodobacteraceae bacterium R_SAG2]
MTPLPFLPRVRQHLQPALDHGGNTHGFEDIILSVLKGDMQLWTADKASAVTEVTDYPKKRVIHWFLAGGDMAAVLDFQQSIRTYGKALGCTEMTLSGRSGWQRALKSHGWTQKGIVMEATL